MVHDMLSDFNHTNICRVMKQKKHWAAEELCYITAADYGTPLYLYDQS